VRNDQQIQGWAGSFTVPRLALLRYAESFRTVATYGPWQLQVQASARSGT
jgi:hypothetical protein